MQWRAVTFRVSYITGLSGTVPPNVSLHKCYLRAQTSNRFPVVSRILWLYAVSDETVSSNEMCLCLLDRTRRALLLMASVASWPMQSASRIQRISPGGDGKLKTFR